MHICSIRHKCWMDGSSSGHLLSVVLWYMAPVGRDPKDEGKKTNGPMFAFPRAPGPPLPMFSRQLGQCPHACDHQPSLVDIYKQTSRSCGIGPHPAALLPISIPVRLI